MGSYRDAAWYPAAAALAGRSRAMASHGRQSREAMRRSRAQRCNGVRCMPPLTGCGFVCCSYAQPAHPSGRPRAARSAPCHSAARSCCPTPTLGNEMRPGQTPSLPYGAAAQVGDHACRTVPQPKWGTRWGCRRRHMRPTPKAAALPSRRAASQVRVSVATHRNRCPDGWPRHPGE
jgi:hypothetical protein